MSDLNDIIALRKEIEALVADQGRLEAMVEHCWYVKKYKEFWVVFGEFEEVATGDTANEAIDAAMKESDNARMGRAVTGCGGLSRGHGGRL